MMSFEHCISLLYSLISNGPKVKMKSSKTLSIIIKKRKRRKVPDFKEVLLTTLIVSILIRSIVLQCNCDNNSLEIERNNNNNTLTVTLNKRDAAAEGRKGREDNEEEQFEQQFEPNGRPRFAHDQAKVVIATRWQSEIFLPCTLYDLDKSQTVSWIRKRDALVLTVDQLQLVEDNRFQLAQNGQNWTLILRQPTDSDAGFYECQVSLVEPRLSHLVELKMLEAKSRISNLTSLFVRPGDQINLTCTIEAPEESDFVYWYKNKESIQFDNLKARRLDRQKEQANNKSNYIHAISNRRRRRDTVLQLHRNDTTTIRADRLKDMKLMRKVGKKNDHEEDDDDDDEEQEEKEKKSFKENMKMIMNELNRGEKVEVVEEEEEKQNSSDNDSNSWQQSKQQQRNNNNKKKKKKKKKKEQEIEEEKEKGEELKEQEEEEDKDKDEEKEGVQVKVKVEVEVEEGKQLNRFTSSLIIKRSQANDTANYTCMPSNAEPSHISVFVIENGAQSQPEKRSLEAVDSAAAASSLMGLKKGGGGPLSQLVRLININRIISAFVTSDSQEQSSLMMQDDQSKQPFELIDCGDFLRFMITIIMTIITIYSLSSD